MKNVTKCIKSVKLLNTESVKCNGNSMTVLSTVLEKWLIEKQLIWHSVVSLVSNKETISFNEPIIVFDLLNIFNRSKF